MPETSIVIKSEDRYSTAVKAMANVTRSFSKDTEEMEKILDRLRKNKYELQLDVKEAREELKALEKQYAATGDEAVKLQRDAAAMKLDTAQRNLQLVSKGAQQAERQMQSLEGSFRKVEAASSGMSAITSIVSAVAAAGASQMIGDAAMQIGNATVASMYGSAGGTVFSSALSSMVSGAMLGSAVNVGVGTAAGAAAGLVAGVATGISQVETAKDEAFKSYVQETAEGLMSEREAAIASGSSIAAGREQTQVAFSTLLGSDRAAKGYLDRVKAMAAETTFTYDEITGYAKSLIKPFGADESFRVMTALSDAGGGLSLTDSDISVLIAGLSRMKMTGKTTQEYLNYFSERGIDVYGALSGWGDAATVAQKVTAGEIEGGAAAEAIISYMEETFGGLSERMAETYTGMVDNLADAQANAEAAYGEGYNAARQKGIAEQTEWLNSGAMDEINRAMGAFYAEQENLKERMIREAQEAVLNDDTYKAAMAAGTDEGYAEAGRMLMEAKARAQSEYNASEGAQLLLETELELAASIREDASSNQAYWDAGYRKGQEYSKGIVAGISSGSSAIVEATVAELGWYDDGGNFHASPGSVPQNIWYDDGGNAHVISGGYAYGLGRVPYDNFPALLHEGERVLTASQARAVDGGGGGVSVRIGNITFGADVKDPEQAAERLAAELRRQLMLAEPG